MADKCKFPEGMVIKPDGIHELDPCIYRVTELHRNVTVEVRQCINCGNIDLVWYPQENSEHYINVSLEEYLEGDISDDSQD